MHRAQPPAGSKKPAAEGFAFQAGLFSTPPRDTNRWLFAPLHYEPGYAYPLLVWLHGPHDDEQQLVRVMPLVSLRNYVAVAPRGVRTEGAGYTWPQTDEGLLQAEQRVFDAIDVARQRYHIAENRIFLAGFDAGGTMALRLGLDHPAQFGGVLSLGGALPRGRTLFGNLAAARRLPLFLAVGRQGTVYPAEEVCNDLRLCHAAGLSITLREYPCGHEISPQMLADVDRWIIEQFAAPRASVC